MKLSHIKAVLAVPILFVSGVHAQSAYKYRLVQQELIQKRLDLYKGSDRDREAALVKMFEEAGCTGQNLSEQSVSKHEAPNIICILPGSTSKTIVVGAHFDHAKEGGGLIDNWSGASLLPTLYQSLSGAPRKHTFVFIGFTDEEEGEIGSAFYVKQLTKDDLSRTSLMVNLDSLGLGPTKVWISRSDKRAVNLLGATANSTNLPIEGIDVDGFGESDEESFLKRRVPTITIHSVTAENSRVLHSAQDAPAALRFKDYYDSYHLLAAYPGILDLQLDSDTDSYATKPSSVQ